MSKRKQKKAIPKKSGGRPSSYSMKLGDLICALLAEGKSLRTICSLKNMPHLSTVLLWVVKGERGDEEYAVFSEQYGRAREAQSEALMDDVIDIADDDRNDYAFRESEDNAGNGAKAFVLQDNINRAKLRIETRFKYASKMHRRKFGEKIQQEITGKDGGPVEINDAKAALLRGLVPDAPDTEQIRRIKRLRGEAEALCRLVMAWPSRSADPLATGLLG